MSTRAQVIVKDKWGEVWFYRHSDGYPEGALPTLKQFLGWVKEGKIRDNCEQSAGWLILIGAMEYGTVYSYLSKGKPDRPKTIDELFTPGLDNGASDWKVGAYEPSCPREHGDIAYLYTIDLDNKEITYRDICTGKTHKVTGQRKD